MQKFSALLFLCSCGIVQLELPDVSRSFSITATDCSAGGELFHTTIAVKEMQERIAGFRGCIESVANVSLAVDAMEYGPGDACSAPRGTASGLALHIDYSAQGLKQSKNIACEDAVDLSDEDAVLSAFNRCLSIAAAKQADLIDALNDSSGVMTVRLTGECSADTCYRASAALSVDIGGIIATNCQ